MYPNAELILGLDIDEKCSGLVFQNDAIKVLIGDAGDNSIAANVQKLRTNFDLIVDDGSHNSKDIITALEQFLPLVNPGGIYVIEDLHASYWPTWGGGLVVHNSAMNYLKKLADIINFEHWGNSLSIEEYLKVDSDLVEVLQNIRCIEFQNSTCIIRMENTKANLGRRVITGEQVLVNEGTSNLGDTLSSPEKNSMTEFELMMLEPGALEQSLNELSGLKQDIAKLSSELREIKKSKLWRWTEFLRKF